MQATDWEGRYTPDRQRPLPTCEEDGLLFGDISGVKPARGSTHRGLSPPPAFALHDRMHRPEAAVRQWGTPS